MKILVTGGAGFIGSHLIDRLIKRGDSVRVFDNLTEQVHRGRKPEYLNDQAEFVRGDVRNREALSQAVRGTDAVVHLAAAVGVAQSQYEIKNYFDVNVGGTANLADILVNDRHQVSKVLLAGSMTSYGEGCAVCAGCGPVRPEIREPGNFTGESWEPLCPLCRQATRSIPTAETAQLRARNMYAVTKRTQEQLVEHVTSLTGMPHAIMRLFNVYGPRQSLSNPYTGVAAIFISRIKGNAPPIVFEDGRQTRDFVWIHDVVDAFRVALHSDRGNNAVHNIGSGRPVSVLDVATQTARIMQSDLMPCVTGQFRQGDIRHCTADVTRARNALGFEPHTSIGQGLEHLIRWSEGQSASDGFDGTLRELEAHRMLT